MADDQKPEPNTRPDPARSGGTAARDPDEWVTGDAPMSEAQAPCLRTLPEATGEPSGRGLSKAEASKRIDALRARDPRPDRRS